MSESDNLARLYLLPGCAPADSAAVDRASFELFYREQVGKVAGMLMYQGARPEDAVEATQEAMMKAWVSWSTIEYPKSWVRLVAERELARRAAGLEEDSVAELPERSPLLADGADIADWEQRHDQLKALANLSPRQRQVMAWSLDGYSPAEIAEHLHILPETVRSNLRNARRNLANYRDTAGEEA